MVTFVYMYLYHDSGMVCDFSQNGCLDLTLSIVGKIASEISNNEDQYRLIEL